MNPRQIKLRMAEIEDGERLAALAKDNEVVPEGIELDWSHGATWWLLAEHEGDLIGAIQLCPSRPFGRLEMLMLRSDLTGKMRAATVLVLTESSYKILKRMGVTVAVGCIPFEEEGYLQSSKARGWGVVDSGNVVMKVLA